MSESEYWKRFMAKRLSRRSVLTGGAVVGAGLVLGSSIGCGSNESATPTAASGSKPGATIAAGAAPTKGPKLGGTLNLAHNQDPPTFDPYINISYATTAYVGSVYNRLVKAKTGPDVNPLSFDLMPDLAESWELPDPTTYIFKLRQGVKYQNKAPLNGREFTSDDVKYSLERLGTNKPEYHAKYMVGEVAKIETPDKYTVKITMKNPFAPFLNYMGAHYSWMMPKELGDKDELGKTMIGTGPFMLDSYERNVKAVYKKNPDYFLKGKPYVDGINLTILPDPTNRIAAFRSKQIDVEGQNVGMDFQSGEDVSKSNPDAQKEELLSRSTYVVIPPRDVKPFDDVRVRRAISLALDRQAFIDTVASGHGKVTGLLPPSVLGWGLEADQLGEYYKHDVTKAKALMAEAGLAGGFKAEIVATAAYGPTPPNVAAMVKDQLKEIGIDCNINLLEYANYLKTVTGTDLKGIVVGPQTQFIDPDEWLYGTLHSQGSRNYKHLKADDKLEGMLEQQRRTVDVNERKKLVADIQKYIADQAFTLTTFIPTVYVVWQPYVKGYRPHAFSNYGWQVWQDVWLEK